jgi:hypothetical protein
LFWLLVELMKEAIIKVAVLLHSPGKLNFPGVVAKGFFESAEEPDHAGGVT